MALVLDTVAIIGSGNIGRSWALLYSSANFRVHLYDNVSKQLGNAITDIKDQLLMLSSRGLSRSNLDPDKQMDLITVCDDIDTAVRGSCIVMECVPEDLDVKLKVLKLVDDIMADDAILGSCTSSFLPSVLSVDLKHRDHFVVMHPTNPPFYARAVELVPAPWTLGDVMDMSRDLMKRLGQAPIIMKKEIEGFVLNRMQFAILGESWRLLKEGVVSIEGLNNAVWSGLGPRYAFLGPFEVGHLNASGIKNYLEKYAPTLFRLQSSMGDAGRMGGQLAEDIQKVLEVQTPLDAVPKRRKWRELRMAALAKLKLELDEKDKDKSSERNLTPLPSDH